MRKFLTVAKQLKNDQDGAALVEYTVLLGILLIAVIAIIETVGSQVFDIWNGLSTGALTAAVNNAT